MTDMGERNSKSESKRNMCNRRRTWKTNTGKHPQDKKKEKKEKRKQ